MLKNSKYNRHVPARLARSRKVAATYDYTDEEGDLLFQVVRHEPKGFSQRRRDSRGRWTYTVKGIRQVPYQLPEILKANEVGQSIFVTEGEKDADRLLDLGLAATCNAGGALKWKAELSKYFDGARVVILPDNDEFGRKHGEKVATELHRHAASIKILELPEIPPKGDVSDWISKGGTKKKLLELSKATAEWQRPLGEDGKKPLLSHKSPRETARAFVDSHYSEDGHRTLVAFGDVTYVWRGTHYEELANAELEAVLYRYLEGAEVQASGGQREPFNPDQAKVNKVIHALRRLVLNPSELRSHTWLSEEEDQPKATDLIAFTNGLLDIGSRKLRKHSPAFFNAVSLPFPYDETAGEPKEWIRFLSSIWGDDKQAIETIQDFFGYVLSGDTSLQKILLVIGPRRAGKGTICRVLERLLGESNVCSPTLTSLGTNFGLSPIVDKSLAVIADARLTGRPSPVLIERLLSISGEDAITLDRKYQSAWTGRLGARFVITTNEAPWLSDSSGALVGRFVPVTMTQSFYDKENIELFSQLEKELAQIMIWALDGLDRLRERGRFVIPDSSRDMLSELEELGSPMRAFIRQECHIETGVRVKTRHLFDAWCRWCMDAGRDRPGNIQSFARDLRSVVPGLKIREGTIGRYYEGLGLLDDDDEDGTPASPREKTDHFLFHQDDAAVEEHEEIAGRSGAGSRGPRKKKDLTRQFREGTRENKSRERGLRKRLREYRSADSVKHRRSNQRAVLNVD